MPYLILVLYSPASSGRVEDEDTLLTAHEIAHGLQHLQHEVHLQPLVEPLSKLDCLINRYQPDLVVNVVETWQGSDRYAYLVAERLQQLQIPYTGNPARVLQALIDKREVKRRLQAAGLATPFSTIITSSDNKKTQDRRRFIVKSVFEHASFGIDSSSVVLGLSAAQELIAVQQTQYGGEWFAEEYIDGREMNVGIWGPAAQPQVLPIAEIEFVDYPCDRPKVVDYAAKWDHTSFESHNTVRRYCDYPEDLTIVSHLREMSLACWHLFEMHGYTRIDFRVDTQGQPWIIDINANPALAQDAGFIASAQQQGYAYHDVLERLLAIALEQSISRGTHVEI